MDSNRWQSLTVKNKIYMKCRKDLDVLRRFVYNVFIESKTQEEK